MIHCMCSVLSKASHEHEICAGYFQVLSMMHSVFIQLHDLNENQKDTC